MSVTVDLQVVEHKEDDYLEEAWRLKERIRRTEGVLKQRRAFFSRAYRRSRVHLLFAPEDELIGFAATRSDGYLLFLAVHPAYRGEGLGRLLMQEVAAEHDSITCHARETNEAALAFYEAIGFERVRRITNYYEDGGNAYYLRIGEPQTLRSRIRDYMGS